MNSIRAKILKSLKKFRYNSMLVRNFVVITMFEMLLVSLMINLCAYHMEKNTIEEIKNNNYSEMKRSVETLDSVLEQILNFTYYLSVENDTKLLFLEQNTKEEYDQYISLSEKIRLYRKTFEYVHSAYLYMEETEQIVDELGIRELADQDDRGWMSMYREIGEEYFVIGSRCIEGQYPFLMTVLYPIRNVQGKRLGAVVVNVDQDKLNAAIGRSRKDVSRFYMTDEKGAVIYSNFIEVVKYPELIHEDLAEISSAEQPEGVSIEEGEREVLIATARSSFRNVRYVMYNSMSEYNDKMDDTRRNLLYTGLWAIGCGVAFACFLTIRTYRPIQNIMTEMEEIEAVKDTFIEGESARNELQYISHMISSTKRKNSDLKMEISDWVERLGHAQLMALQNQINPHFLYNTLDAINWMVLDQMNGENPVSDTIIDLAQLLRIGTKRTSYLVSLREELEHVRLYLKLMNVRYSDQIAVSWEISRDLLEKEVLRLSLQPIVENSIRHGFRKKGYRGNLQICADIVANVLVIRIIDDGVGMSIEACVRTNRELNTSYSEIDNHVGIRNVNQRIKILFGEDFGIQLRPGEQEGLVVILCFPVQE